MHTPQIQTSKIIILSGFIILLFVISHAFTSLYFLTKTNSSLESVENTHDRKLDILMRMTQIVRERSMVMLTMYLEKDLFEIEELKLKYDAQAGTFIRLRRELEKLKLRKEEIREFKEALALIRKTEPLQNYIVDRIRSGETRGLRNFIMRKDLPLEYSLLEKFNKLSSRARIRALAARNRARKDYANSLLLSAFASLAISLSIGFLLYRSFRKIRAIEEGLISESTMLSWDAAHDPLTNIFNRRWLMHRMVQLNEEKGDEHLLHSLLYIDLDGFKPINDNYGHAAGDQYLKSFCREVEHHIRQNDVFARVGGDEFVILLERCGTRKAKEIAEDILNAVRSFSQPFEGNLLSARCSIGHVIFHPGAEDPHELLGKADALCYEAKRRGKDTLYSEDIPA